jgi:hypothetical protein
VTIHPLYVDDPEPDPLYDCAGRAVEAAAALEVWLNTLAGEVGDHPYDKVPFSAICDEVKAEIREKLRPEHASIACSAIDEGSKLMKTRNGLVHGNWMFGSTKTGEPGFRTQRPPRGCADPWADDVEWIEQVWTRPRLIDFINRCEHLNAGFQRNMGQWTNHRDDEGRGASTPEA